MPVHTSALDLYEHQKRAFQRSEGSARQQWRKIPEGAFRDFKELTSGAIPSSTLRRMGHPYARQANGMARGVSESYALRNPIAKSAPTKKAGAPRAARQSPVRRAAKKPAQTKKKGPPKPRMAGAPLLPVNKQTGRLHGSVTLWHRSTAFTLDESVGFDASKAGDSIWAVQPQGTSKVVPRGVFVEVRKRGRIRNRAFQDVFLRDQRRAFATP